MLLSLIFLIVLVAAIVGFVFRHEVSVGGCCRLPVQQSEFDAVLNPNAVADVTGGAEVLLSSAEMGLNQHKEQLGPCEAPEGRAWVQAQPSTARCPSIRTGRVALDCNFWLWSMSCNNFSN